jgi:hypothetical protein
MKSRNKLILEFTEFNLQRLNSDSITPATQVDSPQLSINAFDKHQDVIRQAMSRINGILYNLKGTSAYSDLRSRLTLEDQDIQSMKILRIVKSNSINYDVYISFIINEEEYWGKVSNINSVEPKLTSEVFKDFDLLQPKEWVIKTRGLIIKTIKAWLRPDPGTYRLLNDEVICYSVDTGKQLKMNKGIEVELVRSHENKIIINYENENYNLVGDNFIYFNWWFEKID